MNKDKQQGLTIIELLATLAIVSILIGIAVPSFHNTIVKTRAETVVASIYHTYQLARDHAIDHRKSVYFCGSDDLKNCQKTWKKNLVVFTDDNHNRSIEPEEIVYIEQFDHIPGHIITRAAFGAFYTILSPRGSAKLAGSMIYCPENKDPKLVKKVTWNRIGRPYKGVDKDGDGLVDGVDFTKLKCK